jgi:hypothetical protein
MVNTVLFELILIVLRRQSKINLNNIVLQRQKNPQLQIDLMQIVFQQYQILNLIYSEFNFSTKFINHSEVCKSTS